MALIKNNAEIAAKIAVELHSLDEQEQNISDKSYPVIKSFVVVFKCFLYKQKKMVFL